MIVSVSFFIVVAQLHTFFSCAAEITPALKIWTETKDASKALVAMSPRKRDTSLEGLLLKGLQKHGGSNYVNAMSHVSLIVHLNLAKHFFSDKTIASVLIVFLSFRCLTTPGCCTFTVIRVLYGIGLCLREFSYTA